MNMFIYWFYLFIIWVNFIKIKENDNWLLVYEDLKDQAYTEIKRLKEEHVHEKKELEKKYLSLKELTEKNLKADDKTQEKRNSLRRKIKQKTYFFIATVLLTVELSTEEYLVVNTLNLEILKHILPMSRNCIKWSTFLINLYLA